MGRIGHTPVVIVAALALAATVLVAVKMTAAGDAGNPADANEAARPKAPGRAADNPGAKGTPTARAGTAGAMKDGLATRAVTAPKILIRRDFPDPDVSRFGGAYYAYATNTGGRNVPVASAPAAGGPWRIRGDALPRLGAWATAGRTWAPDVSRRADGRHLLYYTARSTATGRQCIGAALADAPAGPFRPIGAGPLICDAGEGGDIDASSFVDGDGTRYILYKNDGNAIGVPTRIWLHRTAADGITLRGGRAELLRNTTGAERGIIEAPILVKVGGRYVLLYSAGQFGGDAYFTGYATATALTGPYTKAPRALMTKASTGGAVRGPGGADVVRDPAGDHIFFHGWIDNNSARAMYAAAIAWPNGRPVVHGSRAR
jgi:arabinan endo-1,5-alpha-L-arabinosidase